ncbi:MAG: Gldg family protein, partial [Clostridia bacterium]|nr:Gldg family protein [Clostridia bacterium]
MKKRFIRNKKVRYGGITAALTVLIITVTVLANAVVSSLANRYGWYTYMGNIASFDVTEDCFTLLENAFGEVDAETGERPEVKVIFCDVEENVKDYSNVNYYLYYTMQDLCERFDNIKVEYIDIFTNPSEQLKSYTISESPLTGDVVETPLYSTSVIVTSGTDYHYVYNGVEFYSYESDEATSPWAYSGEKEMTSAILRAIDSEERFACFLMNHGEVFYDYELMNLLNDAGYTVATIDLYNEQIPENCEILISYNPQSDLVADEISEKSEVAMLDAFLAEEGHSFLVFLDNGTPSLPNFESYLNAWGVSTDYAERNGVSYRYMVQDSSQTLTSDGYTIYGEHADAAGKWVGASDFVVFRNATSISVSDMNYLENADGSYSTTDGKRTLYPLYQSSEGSVSWANGSAVGDGPSMMMSLTEQKNENGSSYVGVVASVEFAMLDYVQSAVYGNADTLFHLLQNTGEVRTPAGLTIKP